MLELARGLVLASALLAGCVQRVSISEPPAPSGTTPGPVRDKAKIHLKDGRLVVIEDGWRVMGDRIVGLGMEYGPERDALRAGDVSLPLSDVALVETRRLAPSPAIIPLTVATGASLGFTIFCALNAKACFGSCPTFYVHKEGGWALQAEGFSTSIARSLEADDVDDLPDARPEGGEIQVAMRNEALETHLVRRVSLLAVHGPPGSAVLRGFGEGYLAVGAQVAPGACEAPGVDGACALVAARDGSELALGSDGADLAARASITLRYPAPGRRDVALVLTTRNSLMSTFVFYQLIAYLGGGYGDFLAAADRGDPRALAGIAGFDRALGGVEVSFRQGGGAFRTAGSLGYIGPIARATRALSFTVDDPSRPVEVQLTFARAHWKIDAARLAPVLAAGLVPVEIPAEVVPGGVRWGPYQPEPRQDTAAVAASLRGEGPHLATLPGDQVLLRFPVPAAPEGASTAYFLRSRGHYHEWMREEWMREEDSWRARVYLGDPARALRELAPAYGAVERTMEPVFRASRFGEPASP